MNSIITTKARSKPEATKPRLLIFIVAYNAETTINQVLARIPSALQAYETEVLIIDDASRDRTFERGHAVKIEGALPFKLTVLHNPVNQGYGGNQKIGFHFAIERGFNVVALVHGDGQYAPEMLPELVRPIVDGEADAIFGSRMLTRGAALKGGMPLYKFVGNKILTTFQNAVLRSQLSEFHSGYRVYSVEALKRIPFHLNANQFHFDTEIIIQLLFAGQRIKEIPIPTYYGDEICHVNGMRYAGDVVKATLLARAQELSLFYERKFDCRPNDRSRDQTKLGFESPQSKSLEIIGRNKRVLEIGCGRQYLAVALAEQGCKVVGLGSPPPEERGFHAFIRHDLNDGTLPVRLEDYDYVLLLECIEHLKSPETFLETLRQAAKNAPGTVILVSSANIGFIIARLSHLVGQFNYSMRGILDLTNTRLFTFATLQRIFTQNGFVVRSVQGFPAPFPLAVKNSRAARGLLRINSVLIRAWKSLFSYQAFLIVQPVPSLDFLLQSAIETSAARVSELPSAKPDAA